MTPEICPNCGAEVPRNAKACPECGADDETGWAETGDTQHLNLPEGEFDYGDYVKREFGSRTPKPPNLHWFWWIVGIFLLAGILFMVLH